MRSLKAASRKEETIAWNDKEKNPKNVSERMKKK